MRLLVLGGTTEAAALADALAQRAGIFAVVSLAGRTPHPAPSPLPQRIGGFGGADGLRTWLKAERIGAVVDATHPFAAQMSRHAAEACGAAGVPLLAFSRPPWRRRRGDDWIEVASTEAAATALGPKPRRVFLTLGRGQLAAFAAAPWHHYLVRAISAPSDVDALPVHRLLLSRGPYRLADEQALMRNEGVEIVVSKNSGGAATYAKVEAARHLGLPVVMIRRPAKPPVAQADRLDEALAWIEAHRGAP
jgi:precorrin-6A/cobalt-precorrin-6A reductase